MRYSTVMATPLADTFLGAVGPEAGSQFTDRATLEATLVAHVAAGRAAWPGIDHDEVELVSHLGGRLGSDATPTTLESMRADDVYLALACARGDEVAIARFDATYFGEVDRAASRARAGTDVAAEVKARLRRVLFVAEGERPAAAGEFAGRGDLRGWVRVIAMREVVHVIKRAGREVPVADDALFDVLSPVSDPELGYIRDMYREEFATAFRIALEALSSRQRSLLRYQLVEGLSIDEVGALHGVHRATAARWIADARDAISERTRVELATKLGATSTEVESIIRLVRSRLDVSLERMIRSD